MGTRSRRPYDSPESFQLLAKELTELEGGGPSNRLYFLAVPPPLFGVISGMINGPVLFIWVPESTLPILNVSAYLKPIKIVVSELSAFEGF